MKPDAIAGHNQAQQSYFERRVPATMVPRATPYVRRHVDELLRIVQLVGYERALEIGCGMGNYTFELVRRGVALEGLDLSPVLLERLRAYAPPGFEIPLHCADALDPPAELLGRFDAVIGFFTLHHLHDVEGSIAEMVRLLRPGGRFAVSCRNRLYNLLSANAYTEAEYAEDAPRLLAELREHLALTNADELHALAESLQDAADELVAAAAADRSVPPPDLHEHVRAFQRGRRQHTPRELEGAASHHGFRSVETLALHPHPLPPALEPLAPRLYNRLALAWQRPLERSPAGLAYCTAFVAVFERG
jgi:SAM-dependent methyltransferase